jgi:hypothetical protein
MRIADREDGHGARNERTGGQWLAKPTSQAGKSRDEAHQGERPHAGDAGPGAQSAQVEAALDPDQQSAGERRRDRQPLPVPVAVQRSRSACQRRWSAMKLEMK